MEWGNADKFQLKGCFCNRLFCFFTLPNRNQHVYQIMKSIDNSLKMNMVYMSYPPNSHLSHSNPYLPVVGEHKVDVVAEELF